MAFEFIKYDGACKDETCEVGGVHFHGDAGWCEWWSALNSGQREWVQNKAKWEGRSLTAIATEYGAPAQAILAEHPGQPTTQGGDNA